MEIKNVKAPPVPSKVQEDMRKGGQNIPHPSKDRVEQFEHFEQFRKFRQFLLCETFNQFVKLSTLIILSKTDRQLYIPAK